MRRRRGATVLLTTAAALVALSVFLPLWWVFASSMRPGNTYVENMTPLSWLAFIPIGGDFTNYSALGSGAFLLGLFNSFLVAGLTILVGLAIAIPPPTLWPRWSSAGAVSSSASSSWSP